MTRKIPPRNKKSVVVDQASIDGVNRQLEIMEQESKKFSVPITPLTVFLYESHLLELGIALLSALNDILTWRRRAK